MKQKTKLVLSGLGLGLTSVTGVVCVGVGIWVISTMKHPYINQWVDLSKVPFRSIVLPIEQKTLIEEIGGERLSESKVRDYYFSKLTKTPEIIVEDILNQVYNDMSLQPNNFSFEGITYEINNVRVADAKIFSNESNNYFITYQWAQTLDCHENDSQYHDKVSWSIRFENVPIEIQYISGWRINFNLEAIGWNGKGHISKKSGYFDYLPLGDFQINKGNYKDFLKVPFNVTSYYLSKVVPQI